jgi:hypothetical protein
VGGIGGGLVGTKEILETIETFRDNKDIRDDRETLEMMYVNRGDYRVRGDF